MSEVGVVERRERSNPAGKWAVSGFVYDRQYSELIPVFDGQPQWSNCRM